MEDPFDYTMFCEVFVSTDIEKNVWNSKKLLKCLFVCSDSHSKLKSKSNLLTIILTIITELMLGHNCIILCLKHWKTCWC